MIMDQLGRDTIEKSLAKLADMLIINGTLLESPGLWYGRTGVAIFFFHYGHYTKLELFEEYAVEIIEQIQKTIHQDSPVDYSRGLAGIGVGIEYLAQNGFLDINTNEILEDFDFKIIHEVKHKHHKNGSLHNELIGLGKYLFLRLINPQIACNEINMLANKHAITQIVKKIEDTDHYLPDVLILLCKLHRLNICNSNIDYCINKFLKTFSPSSILSSNQPEMAFALMQMAVSYKYIVETACIYTKNILQKITQTGTLYEGDVCSNVYSTLLWLMRCKRLVKQTNINTFLIPQVEMLIRKHIKSLTDMSFEEGKLSLKGCAGMGLIFISMLTESDDTWLDLYE